MSEFASPWSSPGFLLWHATLRWQREVQGALRPLDLTHVQFVLLAATWWLGSQGERPSQRQLAGHAGTDVMMTSQVVRALESKGLLLRDADPDDARAYLLSVTSKGRNLAERAVSTVEGVDRAFFAPAWGDSRLIDLLRVLVAPVAVRA